ncbi:MAG TPA: hypothetical protein VHA78_00010 [Candidatus Peribacteraceae bacterium]|nr:hypothetical protein [Candidatus Peribacteraceae bacterium]
MPHFSYIAHTQDGQVNRGTLEAPSMEDAREMMRKKGWTVEEITSMPTPEPLVQFTAAMPWTTIDDAKEQKKTERKMKAEEKTYMPLVDTLRLFAGWLLAWYGLIYLLGDLQSRPHSPLALPFIDALFTSSLVLRFTFGTFLFLLLTSVHQWLGRGIGKGITLTIIGVIVFMLFHWNVP